MLKGIIARAAKDKKASNIVIMDMRALTSIVDYFVVVSVNNVNQAQAVADNITEKLKLAEYPLLRREGERSSRWILLDCDSIAVHIFVGEEREFYGLERIWGDAKMVDY